MSPQSFKKWKKIKFFYKQMTECFSEIFAQSQLDKERITQLTNRDIKFIGNLKLASESKKQEGCFDSNLINFKKNKTLMLASTHNDEEFQFVPIIKKLLSQINDLKIIIAPRHPERSESILSFYKKSGVSSKIVDDKENNEEDVLIVNTFGNLPIFFNISDIVFLGGSFVSKGGHNPIEPAINNCVIITGPHIYNWKNIYDDMQSNKACIIFNEISELEKNVINLFSDTSKMQKLKERSKKIAQKKFFDSKKLIHSINNHIEATIC